MSDPLLLPPSYESPLPPLPPTYDESLKQSLEELRRLEAEIRGRDNREAKFNVILVIMVVFIGFMLWLKVASETCHRGCEGRHFPT